MEPLTRHLSRRRWSALVLLALAGLTALIVATPAVAKPAVVVHSSHAVLPAGAAIAIMCLAAAAAALLVVVAVLLGGEHPRQLRQTLPQSTRQERLAA